MNQRNIATFLASALVLAACSGGGSTIGDTEGLALEEDSTPTQEQTITAESSTPVEQADSGASELDAFRGVVVVGSNRYEFALAGVGLNCMTILDRSTGATGALIDADGNEIILPEGGRAATLLLFVYADGIEPGDSPASISVKDDGNDTHWKAGAEFEGSEILTVTIEAGVTLGAATFIDDNVRQAGGTPEPVAGSFEVSCG